MKRLIATCLVVVLFSASSAMVVVAAPVTFTLTGTGSGMLNFVPFATSSFIITSQGDTDNRLSFDVGWSITHSSSSIVITGLGTFDILTRTQTAVNNDIDSVVYGTAVSSRYLIDRALFLGPVDAAFSTWECWGLSDRSVALEGSCSGIKALFGLRPTRPAASWCSTMAIRMQYSQPFPNPPRFYCYRWVHCSCVSTAGKICFVRYCRNFGF